MKRWLAVYWPYMLAALTVLLPVLGPGYILTLDAVFTPQLRAPLGISNDYAWQMALHLINIIVPSQVIEKLIFGAILLGAGIGLHRLVLWLGTQDDHWGSQSSWRLAAYAGGLLYAINPYVYDRFMAGQYGVLLGYMLLPWFAQSFWRFALVPGRRTLLAPLVYAWLVSIVSIPTLGELLAIALCVLVAACIQRTTSIRRITPWLTLGLGLVLALSSYWLVPLVMGKGSLGGKVGQFNSADTAAFATVGDGLPDKCMHVLRLQGFWLESHHQFVLPGERLSFWGLIQLGMWVLLFGGAIVGMRRSRRLVAVFAGIGVLGAVLSTGVVPLTAIGYREPQKLAGLVALTYGVFMVYGTASVLDRLGKRSETRQAIEALGVIVLVALWTPTMLWGFGDQLHPVEYPTDWSVMNHRLDQDPATFRVLFLPWHQYMTFGFAGRIIANPAARFFDKPVIVSNNPELGAVQQPTSDPTISAAARILRQAPKKRDLAEQLAKQHIRYVLLAKEYDYRLYEYIQNQQGIIVEQDTPTLTLYRNQAWKED